MTHLKYMRFKPLNYGLPIALALLIASHSIAAQDSPATKRLLGASREKISSRTQRAPNRQYPAQQALEFAIDPAIYVVGPGDVFSIVIEGAADYNLTAEVTPEGKLILPTLGTFEVAGKTVKEVQTLVASATQNRFIGGAIRTHLLRLRVFRVYVTGQVRVPGTYEAYAVNRISDLLELAGGLNNWANARHVELRRSRAAPIFFDYSAFLSTGDLSRNLTLRGGDVIFVPSIYEASRVVRVEGGVRHPGFYAIEEGEAADEFLLRSNILGPDADMKKATVIRNGDELAASKPLPVFADGALNHTRVRLQDGDLIMVPVIRDSVYVQGACRSPGAYPYVAGWKSRDYAGIAGATDQAKSPKDFHVLRAATNERLKGGDVLVEPGDTVVVPVRSVKNAVEYLTILTQIASVGSFSLALYFALRNK